MFNRSTRSLLLAAFIAHAAAGVCAQGHGGPGGGGPGGGPGGGGFGGPGGPAPNGFGTAAPNLGNLSREQGRASSASLSGLMLGPPGRWWDDKKFARSLNLRPEQQKRMDTVFNANKAAILDRFQALQVEESRMQELTRRRPLQESAIFAQVDRVSQARAALEKATAHLSLLLRQEMDPDQIAKLQEAH